MENLSSAAQSALQPSGSKPNRPLGPEYELGLFMFILTASAESDFDIGKEVNVGDRFDDVVIRANDEFTYYQAKLECYPEKNLLNPDVLIGRKSLHMGGFNLLKYFVSYLRINDQFKSEYDDNALKKLSNKKILKKLIIFTNTRLGETSVNNNDIELIGINESTDTVVPKTHSKAQSYKIKETSNDLKQYLRKYLKSDSEILSAELAKYFSPFHQFVYDKDSKFSSGILKYYFQALVDKEIIEVIGKEAKFSKNFIENCGKLVGPAKELRDALVEFLQENNYGKVDEEHLKDKLNNLKLPTFAGKLPDPTKELKGALFKFIQENTDRKVDEKSLNDKFNNLNLPVFNGNLAGPAKEVSDAVIELIQANTDGEVDKKLMKDKLNNLKLSVFNKKKVEHDITKDSRVSPLLLQALTNHIFPVDKCMSLNTSDCFHYYHTALFRSVFTTENTQKSGDVRVSEAFIENDNLADAAKKLRDLLPTSMESHAKKLENYFNKAEYLQKTVGLNLQKYLKDVKSLKSYASSADPENLKIRLRNVKFSISKDFGQSKSGDATIYLPNYDITEESIDDFLSLLEFRLNELSVRDLFRKITNKQIKDRFLMYFDLDPEYLNREIRDIVEEWKKSGGSTAAEGWILNSQRKEFIQYLETKISRPIANHKTREYKRELTQKKVEFDIHFKNYAPFEASYFQTENKIFYIKTDCVLLSALKMLNYLIEEKNEDYIFINVESLAKKEEIMKLANSFQDDKFKSLILSYESSLSSELEQQLFDALSEVLKNHPKNIFVITSAPEDERYKDQFQVVNDEEITLADLENPSKILDHEVIFQDEPTALNLLINPNDINSLKLVNAKTLDEIFKNKPIRIGCRPFATSNLPGAYAYLSEEVNKETFLTNLVCNSSENLFVISGILVQDEDRAKNKFFEHLELSQRKEKDVYNIILKKINFLTHPYSIPANKVIQLVDNEFKDSDFKEFCGAHSGKRVFWVKWNDIKFELLQIYNRDFYIERKYIKFTVQKRLSKAFKQTEEKFVCSGVADSNAFAQLFKLDCSELEQMGVFFTHDPEMARKKFNELSNTVHWLEVEIHRRGPLVVWRNSKGSVENLRKHLGEFCPAWLDQKSVEIKFIGTLYPQFSRKESELLQFLEDKQAVIIADDPGMGKSTTLVKLYGSECSQNDVFSSHWVININLRDHLQAIRAINDGTNGIKEFLSKVSLNLEDNLSQSLLGFTLCAENNSKKPLLITFDGFDEILDEADRTKVLSLLRTLKQKTYAKFYVATRLQHRELLENALSTFSVTFQPLDENEKKRFIVKFFRDRLRLLLTEDNYKEIFGDGRVITQKMCEYFNAFFKKMKLVFVKKIQKFIGTPLQLSLLLGAKGSLEEFKKWVETSPDSEPDFDYLGKNVLEVYENFIAGKYETYSKRAGIREEAAKSYYFKHWMSDCKSLAESKFLFKSQNSLLDHKAMVLAPGLIKYHGNNLEFTHSTFGEYFVSEVFVRWMGKDLKPSKQEKLIVNVLTDDNYQVIRMFINARLASKLQVPPEEALQEYEKIIKKALRKGLMPMESPLKSKPVEGYIYEKKTPLHIAAKEGNDNIVAFLCSIVKNNNELLNNFVEALTWDEYSALHIASEKGYNHVIKKLFEPFTNDKMFIKHLMESYWVVRMSDVHPPDTALLVAVHCGHVETVETLLEPFSDDEEFLKELISCFKQTNQSWFEASPSNAGRNWGTMLHVAVERGFDQILEKLLQYFTNDKEFLKVLMKTPCDRCIKDGSFPPSIVEQGWTVLHRAAFRGHLNMMKKLIIPIIDDENILEELIQSQTKVRKSTVLHFLASREDSNETIRKLLEPFTNDKREQLIGIPAKSGNTALHNAALKGHDGIVEIFLNFFPDSAKEELIKEMKTNLGRTVFHLAVQSGHSNTVEKLLEPFTNKLECLQMGDRDENSSLHIAAAEGHPHIVDQLLSCAKDIDKNWEAFKKLIEKPNNDGKTAFEIATHTVEINEIVKKFIEEGNAEKAPDEVLNLLSKAHDDLSSNPLGRRNSFKSFESFKSDNYRTIKRKLEWYY